MKIFLIAGEASGDRLGAGLVRALKEKDRGTQILGIGGPLMEQAGMRILLPMDQLSVMGIWEVLPKLPHLHKIYKETIAEIEKQKPDAVVTVDLPDFNFFVGKALRKLKDPPKLIHYVAPTVWAWRPGRAKKIAKFLDGLMCLFPFEPRYFQEHGLKTDYVGHPLVEENTESADGAAFRDRLEIPSDAKVLGLLFGSRSAEIKSMSGVIKAAARIVEETSEEEIHMVVPTTKAREFEVFETLNDFPCKAHIIADEQQKWSAFQACNAAIAVSGTVGLELAYMDVPHVICYKTSGLTYRLAKAMIQLEHIHLANIILKRGVVPEFIQDGCDPLKVAEEVKPLLFDPKIGVRQRKGFAKLKEVLQSKDGASPSQHAADFVHKMIG